MVRDVFVGGARPPAEGDAMTDILAFLTQLGYMVTLYLVVREYFRYMTHRLDALGVEKATVWQKARDGAEFVEREK